METLCGILQMDWEIHALQKQCLNKLLSDRGIHFGQPPLLFTLRQLGRCSQKDLAKSLCVSPASIAVSLKRMEKAGLIMRVPDPDDLRSNRIELTEAGKASADYAEQGLREVSGQSYCGFSEEEFSLLMDLYRRMRQNLTDYKEKLEGSD